MYSDHSTRVTLKIWFKTGSVFEEIFPLEKTTFAEVKYLAMKQFLSNSTNTSNVSNYRRSSFNTIATSSRNNFSSDDIENYKIVSIGSKRTMEEEKTLGQSKVKDGGWMREREKNNELFIEDLFLFG